MIKKNDIYESECIDMTHDGLGVIKIDAFPIFVSNLLPTEKAKVKIIKVSKSFGVGKVIEFIQVSKERVKVVDSKGIGTMPLQHMSYQLQLEFKTNQVKKVVQKVGKLSPDLVKNIIPAKQITYYRNKAQVPVRLYQGQLSTGFFKQNSHHFIEVDDFIIQDKKIDEIILFLRQVLREFNVSAYDEVSHSGFLRHLMVRIGKQTNQVQVVFITNSTQKISEKIVQKLIQQFPEVVSVVQNINMKKTNVIMGEDQFVLYGKDLIFDKLLDVTFGISSKSFYQVNPEQTEVLYKEVIRASQVNEKDIVIDAYCGVGTIGLCLANRVSHVYGVEIVKDAIDRAYENATLNHIDNVTYEVGKAEVIMGEWVKRGINPNVIIVDPPRKGLDIHFIESACAVQPDRIVYVSCNPSTMARDLCEFKRLGYQVDYIQPIDLFPFSYHVEAVSLLVRVDLSAK